MIIYPIFCLRKIPYKVSYSPSQIKIKRHENSHFETVDDHSYGGDYFMRLLQMEHRIKFDYTCSNLQDLILSNCRWGIDSKAKVHDLPSFNKIKVVKRKIIRARKNYIWLQRISYPFTIKTNEDLKGSVEGNTVDIIKVGSKWYIKRFLNEINT